MHPEVQCNQSFLFDTVAILNIPRLYFKVAHQKVQCTPIFSVLYDEKLNIPYIYFVWNFVIDRLHYPFKLARLKRRVKP